MASKAKSGKEASAEAGDENLKLMKKGSQYCSAIIVNIGALSLGMIIGWSSPANSMMERELHLTTSEISWIGSLLTVGAASAQLLMGVILDRASRKALLMAFALGVALSHCLLIWGSSAPMLYAGRFLTGFCAGTFCCTVPIFIAEIAHHKIRGQLGVLFQLMITLGILLMFILGLSENLFVLASVGAIVPLVMFILLFFIRESPVYLIKSGKLEEGQKSLQKYRGPDYDIAPEIAEMQAFANVEGESFGQSLKKRASIKAIIASLFFINYYAYIKGNVNH